VSEEGGRKRDREGREKTKREK
jgi:hypothetical protein